MDNINQVSKTFHSPNETHYAWNHTLDPILTIRSGDRVVFNFKDISDEQINQESTEAVFDTFDDERLFPLSGPIYIEGAEVGDTLEIEIIDLQTRGWGWSAIRPGKGLLGDEFTDHYLRIFDLSNGDYFWFKDSIRIPIEPFLGTMGVVPKEFGDLPIGFPRNCGSDIDIRNLTKGSKLFLPVQVEGAFFSAGDGHAAQGDGEVCVTAVESPLYGVLRFTVHKEKNIKTPHYITSPGSLRKETDRKGFYATTGIGSDLEECSKDAIRSMIDYLMCEYKLNRNDAYVLCSLVVDLKISAIVNKPNFIVSALLPLDIFR